METPIYVLSIDENDYISGVPEIGIVSRPAHESNFHAFSKVQKYQLSVQSQERQILGGAFIIPDLPIPRYDEEGKLYHVVFPKEVVKKIYEKSRGKGRKMIFNFEHNQNRRISASIYSDFIIDSQLGIDTPKWHKPLDDGTWFGFVHIDNKEDFEFAKANTYGFSIEGMFQEIHIKDEEEEVINKLREIIKN
jgi:hypothetical protein